MKKFSLFFIAVLISGITYGQFHIGPQVGYTASKLSYKGSDITSSLKNNMLIGVFMRIGRKVYVQPEVNYMTQGSVFKFSTSVFEQDVSLKSIQIPLSLGWQFLNLKVVKLRIFGGVTANFIVNKTITPNGTPPKDYLVPNDFKDIQWQYQTGLGIDILMFAIDVKYYGGINNILDFKYDNNTKTLNGGSSVFEVTLGWKLL